VPAALPCVEPALLGSESSPTTESIRIMGRCAQDSLECCTQQSRQLMDRNQRLCLFALMPRGTQHHRVVVSIKLQHGRRAAVICPKQGRSTAAACETTSPGRL
jgi:hypothetical protein